MTATDILHALARCGSAEATATLIEQTMKTPYILQSFTKPNKGPVITHFRYSRSDAAKLIRNMRSAGFGIRITKRP